MQVPDVEAGVFWGESCGMGVNCLYLSHDWNGTWKINAMGARGT